MSKEKLKKSRRSLALFGLAAASIGLLFTNTVGTGALFTDSQSITNNTFTTGTVILTTTPATAAITMSNMAPGDVIYDEITVQNTGSLAYRYALTQASTNTDSKNLAASLNFEVKSGLATCNAAGWGTGATLNAAGSKFNTVTVFGSPTQGAQAGDRTLAAAASEKLCFRVTLPTSAGNTLQGATTTGTLTFAAEQTKNN